MAETMTETCKPERMNFERLAARVFVVLGGIFWVSAAFGADFGYRGATPLASAINALIPLGLTVAALAIGWFYEYPASGILFAGAVATVAWGVVARWEPGVWTLMLTTLAGPMLVAGILFLLAGRMQKTCDARMNASGAGA